MLKSVHATDWITYLLFADLALIGILRHYFPSRFIAFFRVPVNASYFTEFAQEKEQPFWFNIILETVMIVSVSLFVYAVLISYRGESITVTDYTLLIRIALIVLLFLSIQRLFHSATGYLFNMPKSLNLWMRVKDTYLRWSALGLTILVAIRVFTNLNSSIPSIIGLSLLGLAYVIGVIKGSSLLTGNKTLSGSHIILYLCTLEILPLIVMLKLVT